jgi:hypothetical protein
VAKDQKTEDPVGDALGHAEPAKRAFLKALITGVGFGAPLVVSFSMKGISTYAVHAAVGSNLGALP